MKKLIKIMVVGLFAVGFLYAENMRKEEKGYRIEVVENEIRFVSPDGKVVKRLSYSYPEIGYFALSPTGKYLIRSQDFISKDKKPMVRFYYIDAYGKERWNKEFEIERTMESLSEGDPLPYFFKISGDGSKIVFIRTHDMARRNELVVFDTLGNEICSVSDIPPLIEGTPSDFQISPDGKIIGAEVYPKKEGKSLGRHLFFLHIPTKRIKIVKAEGDNWEANFVLPPYMGTPLGKIYIGWAIYEDAKHRKYLKGGSEYLTFDELPDDLSTFLTHGGGK